MKKTYQSPVTEFHRMHTTTLMAASDNGLQMKDDTLMQVLGGDLVLDDNETSGNLSKGGSIWDAWD